MKRYLFTIILCLGSLSLTGQVEIKNNNELLKLLEENLKYIYNYRFDEAYKTLDEVKKITGDHPVVPFVEGLIIYWRNNPLMEDSEDATKFIALMERCRVMSDSIGKVKTDDMESTFFSLVSRAMLMLHYADNQLSRKVIPYADDAYRLTQQGTIMKDDFKEFYFSTGLYNYYRVAYPEAHPVYKPFLVVFKSGNKELGIKQIRYAIDNTVFLRVESKLYLSYIYMHYENNLQEALVLNSSIYNEFPDNHYFIAEQAELLILNYKFEESLPLVKELLSFGKQDMFSIMKGFVLKGTIEEKLNKNFEVAKKNYLDGITIASEFKAWGVPYKAFAYKGLGRIAEMEGDKEKQKEYVKLANKFTVYEYLKNWE